MSAHRSWAQTCAIVEGLLLRRRKLLGLTQQEVAARIGVSVRTFKRFESEDSEPTFREAVRWAKALGVHFAVSTDCEGDSSVTSGAASHRDALLPISSQENGAGAAICHVNPAAPGSLAGCA